MAAADTIRLANKLTARCKPLQMCELRYRFRDKLLDGFLKYGSPAKDMASENVEVGIA